MPFYFQSPESGNLKQIDTVKNILGLYDDDINSNDNFYLFIYYYYYHFYRVVGI